MAVSYTMLYNALDFPAGVVPVTMVTDEDEEELKSYQGYFQDWWDRTLAKVSGARFLRGTSIPIPSPGHYPCPLPLLFVLQAFRGSVGLPVSVQCVALPWQDELCLRLMKEVETLVLQKNKLF